MQEKAVVLEGMRLKTHASSGSRIKLLLSQLKEFAFFPGQVLSAASPFFLMIRFFLLIPPSVRLSA
jgi:hypothetical protein